MSSTHEFDMSSDFSVNQMNRFANAFKLAGGTPAQLTQLEQNHTLLYQMVGVLLGNYKIGFTGPRIIRVDRTVPFNPAAFLGDRRRWSIAEEDDRSLALTEVDVRQIVPTTPLRSSIEREKRLRFIKEAMHIRLDARFLQALWENKELIPYEWRKNVGGNTQYIFFDGTILLDPDGDRNVLGLCWSGNEWRRGGVCLKGFWEDNELSAVIEVSP